MKLLTVKNLQKTYGGRMVVGSVSLEVKEREIVGLLGPNGAGKTTSFYMIAGLVNPEQGSVHLMGEDVTKLPIHKRAKLGLGYLPQEQSILRGLSVRDNLKAILEAHGELTRHDQKLRCQSLLERFKLDHLAKSKSISLSGGEKRRLCIARCLCTNPKLLMLDEPFSGVDPIAVGEINELVKELRDEDGLSILITDHNARETLKLVDRAYLLFNGEVMLDGTAQEVAQNEIAKQYYFGEDFNL